MQALEEKREAVRADFLTRFAALEGRLIDLSRETEQNQEASIDASGSAIVQLGVMVQNLSLRRKGG